MKTLWLLLVLGLYCFQSRTTNTLNLKKSFEAEYNSCNQMKTLSFLFLVFLERFYLSIALVFLILVMVLDPNLSFKYKPGLLSASQSPPCSVPYTYMHYPFSFRRNTTCRPDVQLLCSNCILNAFISFCLGCYGVT